MQTYKPQYGVRQTSINTYYKEVLPYLNEKQMAVYKTLLEYGGLTNKEISKFLGWDINSVTPRVNELCKKYRDPERKIPFVMEAGTKVCGYSGRVVTLWRVTPDDGQLKLL